MTDETTETLDSVLAEIETMASGNDDIAIVGEPAYPTRRWRASCGWIMVREVPGPTPLAAAIALRDILAANDRPTTEPTEVRG